MTQCTKSRNKTETAEAVEASKAAGLKQGLKGIKGSRFEGIKGSRVEGIKGSRVEEGTQRHQRQRG
jgi:hypothetical protein